MDRSTRLPIVAPQVRIDFWSGRSLAAKLVASDLLAPKGTGGHVRLRLPLLEDIAARLGIAITADGHTSFYVNGIILVVCGLILGVFLKVR